MLKQPTPAAIATSIAGENVFIGVIKIKFVLSPLREELVTFAKPGTCHPRGHG